MSKQAPAAIAKPLKLYACGHAALLAGAWATSATGSMLPMALAGSACLMLTVPLVRHFMNPAPARRR
jgi:hypothetical protein